MDAHSLAALHDSQVIAFTTVAFFALLVYDSFLTMGQEYQYIWRSKNGPIKGLYIVTRYSTFITSLIAILAHFNWGHNPASCRAILRFTTIFSSFGIGVTEIILLVRTHAMYGRPQNLLVFLILMWVVIGGLNIWGLVSWALSLGVDSEPFTSCNLEDSSNFILVCYISRLCGETIIVVLTVYKYRRIFAVSQSSDLVQIFYRDGILWYLAMLSVLLINVVLQSATRPSLKFLGDAPMRVLHAILACRLVLHVRVTADQDHVYTNSSPGRSESTYI